nr:MAG TPA: hypothetical protein [Caudoviricetes sp.]
MIEADTQQNGLQGIRFFVFYAKLYFTLRIAL